MIESKCSIPVAVQITEKRDTMKHIKRITALLCAVCLLVPGFVTAWARVNPGDLEGRDEPQASEIFHWQCMAAGRRLDRAILIGDTETLNGDLPIKHDERVLSYGTASSFGWLTLQLSTRTEAELNAFIDDYKDAPYLRSVSPDHLVYIDEDRFGVLLDLTCHNQLAVEGMMGLLPVKYEYSPADICEEKIKNVYVTKRTGPGLTEEERQTFEAIADEEYRETLRKGIPTQLVLELYDAEPHAAAAFILELTDFEHSALFTEEQKALLRNRISGLSLFSYDGISQDEPVKELAENKTLLVLTPAAQESEFEAKLAASGIGGLPVRKRCCDTLHTLYYLYAENASDDELRRIADTLTAIGAKNFVCRNGVEMIDREAHDARCDWYFRECVSRPGDIDGDGAIASADARLALRAAVGLDELTRTKRAAADVNGDGEVTAADAREILRTAVGLTDPQTLLLTLKVNETAILGPFFDSDGGFVWQLTAEEGTQALITENQWEFPGRIAPPGEISGKTFSFSAAEPGVYRLTASLRQPWYENETESYTLLIHVL